MLVPFLLLMAACGDRELPPPVASQDSLGAVLPPCSSDNRAACYERALSIIIDSVPVASVAADTFRLRQVSAEYLDQACAEGTGLPEACSVLGDLALGGVGTERDWARAVGLYRMACAQGSPDACNKLGDAFAQGVGLPENQDSAIHYFLAACRGRPMNPNACLRAAARIENRDSTLRDAGVMTEEVRRLYVTACEGGSGFACNNLALRAATRLDMVPAGQRDTAYYRLRADSVVAVFDAACQEGNTVACRNLAAELPDSSWAEAQRLSRFGCDLRDRHACSDLGWYLLRRGDSVGAVVPFQNACHLADGGSCTNAGFYGQRVGEWGASAVLGYYILACGLGSAVGCRNAAIQLDEHAERDLSLELSQRACRLGLASGCEDAGVEHTRRGETGQATRYRREACRLDPTREACREPARTPEVPSQP